VILIDVNVLLYAYHPRAPEHAVCRAWVETALSSREPTLLSWPVILGFLRISTHARVFEEPLTLLEASQAVASWLAEPSVLVVQPGEQYWTILNQLLRTAQATGPLVSDAALAAQALESGAVLCITDRDFARFPGLKTLNPLETQGGPA